MAKNQSHLALAKFAEAEKYAPNWGRLHLKWGEALVYAGKKDEAQSAIRPRRRSSISRRPKNPNWRGERPWLRKRKVRKPARGECRGVDPAAMALALGGASREEAGRFLATEQTSARLIADQRHHLHEQFKHLHLSVWEKHLGVLLRVATAVVGIAVAAGLASWCGTPPTPAA